MDDLYILTVDANTFVSMAGNEQGVFFLINPALHLVMAEYTCSEVRRHLTRRINERVTNTDMSPQRGAEILAKALTLTESVAIRFAEPDYGEYEAEARDRVPDDPDDWHTVALALALDLDIWTDDKHFLGCGVPVWTTKTLRLRLAAGRP